MAKIEIELSDELRTLLTQHAEQRGIPEATVVESALNRELKQLVMSTNLATRVRLVRTRLFSFSQLRQTTVYNIRLTI